MEVRAGNGPVGTMVVVGERGFSFVDFLIELRRFTEG